MADNKNVNNAPEDDDAEFITLQFEDSEDIECESGIHRSSSG